MRKIFPYITKETHRTACAPSPNEPTKPSGICRGLYGIGEKNRMPIGCFSGLIGY